MKTKEDYIQYKLKRSAEVLSEAETLLENNFYEDTVSRLYYASFYAICALLIYLDLNPKTHQGVKSLFHKEFIYTGKMDKKFSDFYSFLMAKGFEVDYQIFSYLDKEQKPFYITQTIELVNTVKQQLNLKL
jgi:uncharacterized protein (UPF0332 family)